MRTHVLSRKRVFHLTKNHLEPTLNCPRQTLIWLFAVKTSAEKLIARPLENK